MVYSLTSFRAIAFLAVFFAHSKHLHIDAGYLGVQMFFVLSGFLLTPIIISMKSSMPPQDFFVSFYARRALRIFPLYFVYLGVVACACKWVPVLKDDPNALALLDSLPCALTYTYNFYHASLGFVPSKFVTHFWSLAVEEQFYLIFPLAIFLVPSRRIKYLLAACVLLGPVLRYVTQQLVVHQSVQGIGSQQDLVIYVSPFSHLDAFAMGGLFAVHGVVKTARYSWWMIAACVGIGFGVEYLSSGAIASWRSLGFRPFMYDMPVFGYSLVNLLFGFLLVQVRGGTFMPDFFSHKMVHYLGEISYGMYVFHLPLLFLVREYGVGGQMRFVADACALALTIALSALSYRFMESRFISAKDAFFPKRAVSM